MNVYVIVAECEPPLVKVGISDNAEFRLSLLRTGSPYRLTVAHSVAVEKARAVERLVHHNLSEHRTSGEWFAVSAETAISAVKNAISVVSEIGWRPPWNENYAGRVIAKPRPKAALRATLRVELSEELIALIKLTAEKESRSMPNMAERLLREALKARKAKSR